MDHNTIHVHNRHKGDENESMWDSYRNLNPFISGTKVCIF